MKYVNCNLCGADNWVVRFHSTLETAETPSVDTFRCTSPDYGEHAQIVACTICGHVYANPTWDDAELIQAYSTVVDETYAEERDGRTLTFEKHLDKLEALIGKGDGRTILDVGAYIGVFVEVAQTHGWNALGIEPSEWAVGQAKARGLPVVQGTLEADVLHGRTFDVVTMWDVIEHVTDPLGELEKAHNLLKSGGTIVVHTMDLDSTIAKIMRGRWPWLMAMHVHYFGRRTLSLMLEKTGFDVVRVAADGRYLRLGYLASRIAAMNQTAGKIAHAIVKRRKWGETAVPINFGDLMTITAVKR